MMYRVIFCAQLILLAFSSDVSNNVQSLYCELGLNGDNLCPINGGFTSWNAWSPCTGECGSKGKRRRSRSCNNPSPSNNGALCIGPSYQIESCQITGCTIKDYEKIVRNHPVRKKEMKVVDAVHKKLPALIELCFSVDCTFSIVEKILGTNAMAYWNAMNCVKYDVGCPITGAWSHWEAWSPCTAVCGKGKKYRTRRCNSPAPSDPELTCDGGALEMKDCNGANCKKHLMGTWHTWSRWSACSIQCGRGIKIRKRSCVEVDTAQRSSCEGPGKEIQACQTHNCSMDGVWSPWTVWTTCSSECGIGKQIRNRMCNNPSPSGSGVSCSGSGSEVRNCFTKPCIVKTHEIALFTGESSVFYAAKGKPSRLLHIYLRFLPLAPFGMLIYRSQDNCEGLVCDFVKLSLHNGKVVLLSQISGCTVGFVHEDKLEIGQWHMVLALIYGTYATLRVDSGSHKVAPFSCAPLSQNLDHSMKIGEGFHGQIQEIAINFASLRLRLPKGESDKDSGHIPHISNYVQYLIGDDEEGLIHVALTESIIAPCPQKTTFWRITIALKSEDINGILALIPDSLHKYILLVLEEGRIKLKVQYETVHAMIESTEHVLIGEWFEVMVIQDGQNLYMQINGNEKKFVPFVSERPIIICRGNTYVGAIPDEIREKICPDCAEIPQTSFILGYLDICGTQLDLLTLPCIETTSKRLASRTISLSDYYQEVPVLWGHELKLSCFYDKIPHKQNDHSVAATDSYVRWLLIDKPINFNGKSNNLFTVKDNGRISTVTAASYISRNSIENFYTCYIRHYQNNSLKVTGHTFFTFGVTVIDENKEVGDIPWIEWGSIYGTTILCFIFAIVWCLLEAVCDIRNGHGFYRLRRMDKNDDPTSMVTFILSTDGIILLGSRQAADEIVEKVIENSKKLQANVTSAK